MINIKELTKDKKNISFKIECKGRWKSLKSRHYYRRSDIDRLVREEYNLSDDWTLVECPSVVSNFAAVQEGVVVYEKKTPNGLKKIKKLDKPKKQKDEERGNKE